MSDFQQAPDWWLASDGKWYAPQPAEPLEPLEPPPPPGPPMQPPAYDPNVYQQGYPPPPAPGYQQPYQPYPVAANPFESRATTVLVLGILSLLCLAFLGPVAWVMGNGIKKEAQAAGFPEPGNSKAGRICGIIGTVFLVLGILYFIIVVVVLSSVSVNT